MFARRLTPLALLILFVLGTVSEPVLAQFTPRFSSQRRQTEGQLHLGFGSTVMNISDYTSEAWPEFEPPVPVLYARLGYAIPLTGGEKWYVLTEIEANTANASGLWSEPQSLDNHEVTDIAQGGAALTASAVFATEGRKMLIGGGIGFYLLNHDPERPGSMLTQGEFFLRDPFKHLGFGLQAHVARAIAKVTDTTQLMVEVRYRTASLAGNVPRALRNVLLSEVQLGLYLAIK